MHALLLPSRTQLFLSSVLLVGFPFLQHSLRGSSLFCRRKCSLFEWCTLDHRASYGQRWNCLSVITYLLNHIGLGVSTPKKQSRIFESQTGGYIEKEENRIVRTDNGNIYCTLIIHQTFYVVHTHLILTALKVNINPVWQLQKLRLRMVKQLGWGHKARI